MPDEREVAGLLALMLLTDARRAARTGPDGALVLLEDQDRARWDPARLTEGVALARESAHGRPGRFVLQAAVAAEHGRARTYDETDWQRILDLYDAMLAVWPSPGRRPQPGGRGADGARPGDGARRPAVVAEDPRMTGYRYLPSTRADLLRRLGRRAEAAAAYREAIAAADNAAERAFLTGRLAEVSPPRREPDGTQSAAGTSAPR